MAKRMTKIKRRWSLKWESKGVYIERRKRKKKLINTALKLVCLKVWQFAFIEWKAWGVNGRDMRRMALSSRFSHRPSAHTIWTLRKRWWLVLASTFKWYIYIYIIYISKHRTLIARGKCLQDNKLFSKSGRHENLSIAIYGKGVNVGLF